MRLTLFEELKGRVGWDDPNLPAKKENGELHKVHEKKHAANRCFPDFKMVVTYFRREKELLFSFVLFHSTQPKRSITSLFVRFGEEKTPDLGVFLGYNGKKPAYEGSKI